jgi:aspartyl-tRNA(Asn)/glutamyl-tRNA(Gln) amidotransferase subunit A
MSWQFDHPGPICRTVEDAAIMLQAIAGYDPDDFATVPVPVPDYREGIEAGVRGLRIGVPREQFFSLLDPEVRVAVEDAIGVLAGLGAEVADVDLGITRERILSAWPLVNAEGQLHHQPYFGPNPEAYSDELRAVLTTPLPDALSLTQAYRASYDTKESLRRTFESLDVLVTPTTLATASAIGEERVEVEGHALNTGAAFAGNTMPFNIAGLPAISLPCGFDSSGLPIGLQIAGGPFQEALVLRAARAYEAATDWHTRTAPC